MQRGRIIEIRRLFLCTRKVSRFTTQMLEGFEPRVLQSAPKGGRPARAASNALRNLAWLRYLLSSLDDVCAWAGANTETPGVHGSPLAPSAVHPPLPEAWRARPADAAELTRRCAAIAPRLPSAPLDRSCSLLDEVFGTLFGGVEGAGGRYFSDRLLRGIASPDASRLHRLDELVPGSRHAFEHEPPGVDPWFYNALDFGNPWFGKLFVWRAADPSLEDPGWDDLVDQRTLAFNEAVLAQQSADYTLTEGDVVAFERLIEHAAATAAFPFLAYAPLQALEQGIADVLTAAAAGSPRGNAVRDVMSVMPVPVQWRRLTDALAARRLSMMIDAAGKLTRWWLRSTLGGLTSEFWLASDFCYCRLPKKARAVEQLILKML